MHRDPRSALAALFRQGALVLTVALGAASSIHCSANGSVGSTTSKGGGGASGGAGEAGATADSGAAGDAGSGGDASVSNDAGAGGAAGSGAGGAAGAAGGAAGAGGLDLDAGCSGNLQCSPDLHSVLDCHGNVFMACPAGQGCANGACTGACDSAIKNKSSFGCDYYAVDPDVMFDGAGGCYAAFVVNTWTTDVALGVEYKGQTLDPTKFGFVPSGSGGSITYSPLATASLAPGQIAILFLNRFGFSPPGLDTDCPPGVVPAISNADAAQHGTGIGAAFHISTSAPVVAYDIYPYGGGQSAMTSATLLLPTTAWGDNYVGVSAFGNGLPFGNQPFLSVVAQQNGTIVTILPSADVVPGAGVAGGPKLVPETYTLQRGQVLQFTQGAALDGSVIQSTAPVGVWGGSTALAISACCDESAHQQIPPVRALGSEYVGVRYRNRYDGIEETPPWRMVGAVDGTVLTWEPSTPAGAPTTLGLGQVAQFEAAGPFVVRSQDDQHPFYVSAHMTGGGLYDPQTNDPNAAADGRGDAEFVNVIPPGEWLDDYIFFTDPTYPETDLVVVRAKGSSGFADVTLDCAGTLGGWQPLGSSGKYEYTRIDLVRHAFQPQGSCNNGRHEISSAQPFGLTVWGWGSAESGPFYSQYVSYAYPAGAGVEPINPVVIPTSVK